jgi:diguanylate cyclase (GGDEF)-like protein/putative nucleotidyltransferase with HDIG domain
VQLTLAPAPIARSPAPAGRDLPETLARVAASVCDVLGFGTAVINLYRPAWDDFETMVVHGSPGARETLLHSTSTAAEWSLLIDERFNTGGAYFIPHGTFDWDAQVELSYVPDMNVIDAPDAWHPEDAMFVPLRASDDALLGIMSVDEPADGLRPHPERLDALVAVASQTALAIEAAQQAATASRHRAAVEHLLRVSAELTSRPSGEQMLDAVGTGIRDALGFDKVTIYLRDQRDVLVPRAAVGWSPAQAAGLPALPLGDLEGLLDPTLLTEGCVLLDQRRAHELTGPSMHTVYRSVHNGRGPHGWNRHWLIVPLHDSDGRFLGLIWVDDPLDRLRPTSERLKALRAFANQAASALEATAREERLRYLAEHDPLTGLRNRRGLTDAIDAVIAAAGTRGVAVVVADVDGFKRVNDELGYEAGDAVLQSMADALRDWGAIVARLGGEEFAVVLPHHDAPAAYDSAEHLRARAASAVTGVPWPVTVSAGVAVSGPGLRRAEDVLRAATRAVFAAKRLGRDRVVAYHAEALEAVLGKLDGDAHRGSQLAAAMLMAEALDMRDAGTARHSETVGRYAEQIAAALGWDEARVARMRVAGVLHDIGKLGVSDALLHKCGPLADEERQEIERHAELGARMLQHAQLPDLAAWVLAHHERMDGLGYPRALVGDEIPQEARILAVADAYEAMTTGRPYRVHPVGDVRAREELRRHAGTQFDPEVVEAFLRVLGP